MVVVYGISNLNQTPLDKLLVSYNSSRWVYGQEVEVDR